MFYFRRNVKENVLRWLYLRLVLNPKLQKNPAKVEKVQAKAKHLQEKNPKRKNDKHTKEKRQKSFDVFSFFFIQGYKKTKMDM
jgi:hypothetical protein